MIIFFFFFYNPVSLTLHWFNYPLLFIDFVLFMYLIEKLIKISLFLFAIAAFSSQFYSSHYSQLYIALSGAIKLARVTRNRLREAHLVMRITLTVIEHTAMSRIIIFVNDHLWSSILFVMTFSQVPGNIYMIYRILLDPLLNGWKGVLTWTIMLNQFGMLMSGLCLVAHYSKVIFDGHRLFTPAQQLLGSSHLTLKMKCCSTYERVSSKHIGVSIGPTGTVTYRVIFQVGFQCCHIKLILQMKTFSDCYSLFCLHSVPFQYNYLSMFSTFSLLLVVVQSLQ